jgi:cobalamin-dependent methionine synthase I
LFGLRQQTERDANVYMCLSDFISSTTTDYIGVFALAVFNVEQEAQRLVQKVRRKKAKEIDELY